MIQFLSHNVKLPSGSQTMPLKKQLLEETQSFRHVKDVLIENFSQHKDIKNFSALDLGCMEGGFSLLLAQFGFKTTGIEARKQNIVKARFLQNTFQNLNLTFVQDNILNLEKYGPADFMFCSGVLYHLEKPHDFIELLYKNTNKVLYLQSFVAPEKSIYFTFRTILDRLTLPFFKRKIKRIERKIKQDQNHLSWNIHVNTNRLSPFISNIDGYNGRTYKEWMPKERNLENPDKLGASIENEFSFWLTKSSILEKLKKTGFKKIYEIKTNPTYQIGFNFYPKVIFVAIK